MKHVVTAAVLIASALAAPMLTACASGPDDSPQQVGEVGTLKMNLQSTSAQGTLYQLQNAVFNITQGGLLVSSVTDGADPTVTSLSVDLDAGTYDVTLGDGWVLNLVGSGGLLTPVDATLVSASTQSAVISNGVTTSVTFVFKVNGQQVVLGGTLVIETHVIDACTEDAYEDNDTQAAATPLPAPLFAGQICAQDQDWYQLPVDGSTLEIILDFQHANGDLDMALYDASSNLLAQSASVTDNESIVYAPTPQDVTQGLWLLVVGFGDAQNSYYLSVLPSTGVAPAGWTCASSYYGTADGCDCGCGVVDPDCAGGVACMYCNDPGACSFDTCDIAPIDPVNPGQCL